MLLTQKALIEGRRLLALHAGTAGRHRRSRRGCRRARARRRAGRLPHADRQGLQTEWGVEYTYHALQCFGGHGYIAERGMEQFARDARITTLYEGTTGIQALDLIGRKTAATQGAGLRLFLAEIEDFCSRHDGDDALSEFIAPLREKSAEWQRSRRTILQRAAGNADELGAASYDYLFYSGYVALAYWWARSVAALASLAHSRKHSRHEARDRALLLRPHPAAHAGAQGRDRQWCGGVDEYGRRTLRQLTGQRKSRAVVSARATLVMVLRQSLAALPAIPVCNTDQSTGCFPTYAGSERCAIRR